jgi:hypothetical protein
MPVARQSPRAPAILRPCVDVLLLSFGILSPKFPIALVLPLLPLQGNQGDVIWATQPPQKYVKYDKTRGEYPMQEYTNLGEAIMATQPIWLITYLYVLVAANLGAVFFIAKRTPQGWRPRYEAIAIIVAFLMARRIYGLSLRRMWLCAPAWFRPYYVLDAGLCVDFHPSRRL